jgi:hypothetical protein
VLIANDLLEVLLSNRGPVALGGKSMIFIHCKIAGNMPQFVGLAGVQSDFHSKLFRGIFALKQKKNWLLTALGVVLCLVFYIATMLPQDRIYAEYKQALKGIPHPSGTKFITDYNAFGALDKTRVMYKDDFGQGCDYRVGEVREYSGSKETIKAFYAAQTIQVRGKTISPAVLFIPMSQSGEIDPYAMSEEEVSGWGPHGFNLLENLRDDQHFWNIEPRASYYYLGIGGFSETDQDIRCQF